MLSHFCRVRKWVPEALDKTHVPRQAEPEKSRVILTIEQAARLMETSRDPDICALNAMVLFGGLRRDEVEKLDWSAVNFRTGHIEVSAAVSKVSRERFAPMPENLREWLMPIARKRGPIVSRILMRALRGTWKRAALYPWPQDAHRHSFISYHAGLSGMLKPLWTRERQRQSSRGITSGLSQRITPSATSLFGPKLMPQVTKF